MGYKDNDRLHQVPFMSLPLTHSRCSCSSPRPQCCHFSLLQRLPRLPTPLGFLSRGPWNREVAVHEGAGWKQTLLLTRLPFPKAGLTEGFCKQQSSAQPQMDVVVGRGVVCTVPCLPPCFTYISWNTTLENIESSSPPLLLSSPPS